MSAGSVQTVVLPTLFAQVQLSGLKDIVNHHRDDGDVVQFDAAEVERIDGAAVQFLLAVSQMQKEASSASELVINAGDLISNALNDMGLGKLICIRTIGA